MKHSIKASANPNEQKLVRVLLMAS